MKKLMLVIVTCVLSFGAFAQGDSTQRKMVPPDINDNSSTQDRRNSSTGNQRDSLNRSNRSGTSGSTSDTTGRGRSNNASDLENNPMHNNQGSGTNRGTGTQSTGTDRGTGTQGTGSGTHQGSGTHHGSGTHGTGNQGHDNSNNSGSHGNSKMDQDKNANNPVKVNPTQDGVLIMDGKVVVIKSGQQSRSTEPVNLLNGSRILADGTLVDRDGTRTKLKEGDYLDFSGKYLHRNPSDKPRNSSTTTPVTPSTPDDRDKVKEMDKNKDVKKDKGNKTMYLVPDSSVKEMKKD